MMRQEYEQRCSTYSDIQQHLPTLYHFGSAGDVLVIELGVRSGMSTAAFLAAVEEHGGHVWSVDIVPPRIPWQAHPNWTLLIGDDLTLDQELPDGVDVVFIDTSHTYAQTQAELELYADKLRPGGVFLLHDTELERPEDSPPSDPPFPVMVAAREFADEYGWQFENMTGCYGLGILTKPEVAGG